MVFELRKTVEFAKSLPELAEQVGQLARDLLAGLEEAVSLDGSSGPLIDTFDAGLQEIVNVLTLTHATEPQDARIAEGLLTVDWNAGQVAEIVLRGNASAVQFVDPPGGGRFVLYVTQDTAGNTIGGWQETIDWPAGGAPVITAAAGSRDKLVFDFDGTRYSGEFRQDYS
jgi:hypothetical protein